ncbi:hypothetical protein FC694_03075 [Bacillus wiedmannii]|uniref:Uncharacterized protein n=1 Tax=Bacillus wiedmannii TaxID=1890302 RepID=A0A4U2N7F8_9BACI|nr:hypothetical protein [Bacillus wiedmannii]TKH18968.1 hypothetical protein FC694_03075 [Bacillus wiedmannii]
MSLSEEHETNVQKVSSKLCCEEIPNNTVPFCCIVNIPKGFEVEDDVNYRIGYSLQCLFVSKDKYTKEIQVDNCGPVELCLNLLKVVGCIQLLINLEVKSNCIYSHINNSPLNQDEDKLYVCCEESVCVDNVLKCSMHELPDYCLSCETVYISDVKYEIFNEDGCQFVKFSGEFKFESIK